MPTVHAPRALRRVRSRIFEIEDALLRASVDALSADRHKCRHCHRTPLTGETIHFYASRHGADAVCELCRPLRVAAPDRTELVRHPEQASTVHLVAP